MAGFSNYLRNKIIDWLLRGKAFTPPTIVYVTLCSTAPTASTGGTEISPSRIAINCSTTAWAATNGDGTTTDPSSGTTGTTSNNAIVDFGTAGSNWGTASHWELYDAASAGNRLIYGTIVDGVGTPTPRSIVNGDPVSFPISYLRLTMA